jgi:hypothetical protein
MWAVDLSAGIDSAAVMPIDDPLSPASSQAPLDIDPVTLPVEVGPGDNVLVDGPIAPPDSASDLDPSQVPVGISPGQNELVFQGDPAGRGLPTAVDVVAGVAAMMLSEPPAEEGPLAPDRSLAPILPIPDLFASPASPWVLPTRPPIGSARREDVLAQAPNSAGPSVIDEILALDAPARNQRMREFEERLTRWPTDAEAADEGVTQWLRAIEQEPTVPNDQGTGIEGTLSPDVHADESVPRLLLQLGALGVIGSLWRTPPAKRRSEEEGSRGDRHRMPVEYYGTLVSLDSLDRHPVAIQVRDLSEHGMGILHFGPLPGRRVTVVFSDGPWGQTKRGLVRWTRRLAENVFASGISFHELG